jgi:hydrogenase/urease accessory protein HupE
MRVLTIRLLAAMCLVAALPLACIKYPWMPATVMETVASYHEPFPDGSASYLADRRRQFVEWHYATGLYVLGTASLVGLWSVATQRTSRRGLQAAFWVLAGVTGIGVAGFERPKIESALTNAYAIMAVWLPLAITTISIIGLMLTMGLRSHEKPPPNSALERTGHE